MHNQLPKFPSITKLIKKMKKLIQIYKIILNYQNLPFHEPCFTIAMFFALTILNIIGLYSFKVYNVICFRLFFFTRKTDSKVNY